MKTFIKKYACIAVMAVSALTSCDLDSKVYSSLSDSNFPQTEEDARLLITGIYGNFKCNSGGVNNSSINGVWTWPIFGTGEGWWGLSTQTTDECFSLEKHGWQQFAWGSALDTYSTYTNSRNITRCTKILDAIDHMTGISEQTRNQLVAETKCLRGWLMFHFYDLYGPVPFTTDPSKIDDVKYEPRPTKEVYFAQMTKDLEEAMPYLYDKTNGTSNWGRVNKGLCNMLLMKLYMNDHQWDKALTYAKKLMTMGYSLADNYFDVFNQEENNENIWSVPSGPQMGNEWFFYAIPPDCSNVCGQEVNPCWGVLQMPWDFYDTFADCDKRKTGISDHYDGTDGKLHTRNGDKGSRLMYGAIVVKYFYDKDRMMAGDLPLVVCRYADVLLSMAEILNNLNGPSQEALNYVKQITDRAGTTSTIPADVLSSKEKFNEFLLAERGRELYWEGWRREDLIRFGKYIETGLKRGFPAKDHMVLFPIPPRVITESGGVVKNNPGYE